MPREVYELTPPQMEWLIENQTLTGGEALDESAKMGWGAGNNANFGQYAPSVAYAQPHEGGGGVAAAAAAAPPPMAYYHHHHHHHQQQPPSMPPPSSLTAEPPSYPPADGEPQQAGAQPQSQQAPHGGEPIVRAPLLPREDLYKQQRHPSHQSLANSASSSASPMETDECYLQSSSSSSAGEHAPSHHHHSHGGGNGSNNHHLQLLQHHHSHAGSGGNNNASSKQQNDPYPHRIGKLTWEQSFENLKIYVEKNGHCNVPRYFNEHPQLGSWVHRQRLKRKSPKKYGFLSPEQVGQLTDLGFCWQLRGEGKQQYINQAKAHLSG